MEVRPPQAVAELLAHEQDLLGPFVDERAMAEHAAIWNKESVQI